MDEPSSLSVNIVEDQDFPATRDTSPPRPKSAKTKLSVCEDKSKSLVKEIVRNKCTDPVISASDNRKHSSLSFGPPKSCGVKTRNMKKQLSSVRPGQSASITFRRTPSYVENSGSEWIFNFCDACTYDVDKTLLKMKHDYGMKILDKAHITWHCSTCDTKVTYDDKKVIELLIT